MKMELNKESDDVLRKHVQRVTGVADTNITTTSHHTESRNEVSIKLEEDLDENCRMFEEVALNYEFPTSSKKEISAKSLKDPLSIADMQDDMYQVLDIDKQEIDVDIKIEKDEDRNFEVYNAIEKPHTCTVCDKSFIHKQQLTSHMRTHAVEKPYACTVCNKAFQQTRNLVRHIRTHKGETPSTCTVCDKSFIQRQQLASHMLTHAGHTCTVCNISFKRKSNLERHIRTHTEAEMQKDMHQVLDIGEHDIDVDIKSEKDEAVNNAPTNKLKIKKPYSCTMCDTSFIQKHKLEYHMRAHTGMRPYACTVCNKSFQQTGNLVSHVRTHTGEKPHACTLCDQSFLLKQQLTYHIRMHTGEKPHTCTLCDQSFIQKQQLTIHMQMHTGVKPHTCTVCNKSFQKTIYFTIHKRTHTGEKPYTCTVCGKSFVTKKQVEPHMRTHTVHTCTVCNESFRQKRSLVKHMRTHTVACAKCDKTFMKINQLRYHMRLHAGEKSYTCAVCGKSFMQKYQLIPHMRTHTGVKPYTCSVCDKSFSQKQQLTYHMRTHTGVKPYACTVCDKLFIQKHHLTRHIRKHTGVEMQEDMHQVVDIEKQEIDVDIKIEKDDDVKFEVNNASTNKLETDKPYSCTMCSKSFKQKKQLTSHMRTHTGVEMQEDMHQVLDIVKHEIDVDIKIEKDDDVKFEVNNASTNKLETDKPYSCTMCSKSFKQKKQLTSHMRTHTGVEMQEDMHQVLDIVKHEIDVDIKIEKDDDVKFEVNNASTNKLETDKPYSCTMCSKSFKQKKQLTSHMRTHTGVEMQEDMHQVLDIVKHEIDVDIKIEKDDDVKFEVNNASTNKLETDKPYSCTMCSKSFKQKKQLTSHMRTHTGVEMQEDMHQVLDIVKHEIDVDIKIEKDDDVKFEVNNASTNKLETDKPYSCTMCSKSFKQKKQLTSHMRTHTGVEMQEDMHQVLDIVKHEIDVDIKIEKDDDVKFEVDTN